MLNFVAIVQIDGNKPQNCAWNAVLVSFLIQCENTNYIESVLI